YQFQMIGTFGIIVIFVILFASLILTARRAELIIAKQHEKNLDLTAAAARAEAASREKSQFLANISHELRTPLNAIIGFSDIIKNETLGAIAIPQYKEYISDIHTSGTHLLSLINDILDYSKAEAGKLELEVAEVEIGKTIKTSMRLVEPRAEAAQVTLVQDLPKEPQVLKTDAKKLKQVLLNLLSNAVKFTPAGGQVKVSSWHNLGEDSVSIVVQDTGIGIAPKDIPKAMTPFGQVDSELSRKYEGTGLGLPLTKKFVETMGGKFEITSELGVGTTITITLPRVAPEKFWKKGSNVAAKTAG
ncbi:MAG: HAMP domain-containing histidine kinase, partial [Alphaproteobacteria bacterium]|nr:HAMP domain-containing histidine kinase [Alphaproteobacteria bacterium]